MLESGMLASGSDVSGPASRPLHAVPCSPREVSGYVHTEPSVYGTHCVFVGQSQSVLQCLKMHAPRSSPAIASGVIPLATSGHVVVTAVST
jgi:hypothetical protein